MWTFGTNSDDGVRIKIDRVTVIDDDSAHSPEDRFGAVTLTEGYHDLELLYFEREGGAEVELFAAPGSHTAFSSNFQLIGDTANGGLALGGFGYMVNTDISNVMRNRASSLYLRKSFAVNDPSNISALFLGVFYADGFAAYINGHEIARLNAPESLAWNSTSLNERVDNEVMIPAEIQIAVDSNVLHTGENTIAIHGLNSSAADNDFLIYPLLFFSMFDRDDMRYFQTPTPGYTNRGGVLGFAPQVGISQPRGFYDAPFQVTMHDDENGDRDFEIRYTTDGSLPAADTGTIYTGPIDIQTTATLRAAAFRDDFAPGPVTTQTYIFLEDVIQQERRPEGFPASWNGESAYYEMDPDVAESASYRDTIINDLQTLPSISIVMDVDDLFGSEGIYTNANSKGDYWERPTSAELIYPGSREGFQIDCGIQIQGGYSRGEPKRSFRLMFKQAYGPAKLDYPLFPDSEVTSFDTIVLRGNYNYTWHASEGGFGSTIGKADYLRDEFSRKTQLALGQPSSHGTFAHLYLNGLYWGVYNICERPDASFSSSYLGGGKDEWDVITGGTRGTNTTQVKDGNKAAWNEMMQIARSGSFSDPDRYAQIQEYVDLDNLIDYMLTIYYTGNRDAPTVIGGGGTPWNFYSSRRRLEGEGIHFYTWDSEWTLEEPDRDVTAFHYGSDNPACLFRKLTANPEFVMRAADRVQQHFFNDGALTPGASIARYAALAAEIDRAIVGESARWGDTNGGRAKTRDDDWAPEIQRLLTEYFPVRTANVLDQLRKMNWYPELGAPEFSSNGGVIPEGFQLTMRPRESGRADDSSYRHYRHLEIQPVRRRFRHGMERDGLQRFQLALQSGALLCREFIAPRGQKYRADARADDVLFPHYIPARFRYRSNGDNAATPDHPR